MSHTHTHTHACVQMREYMCVYACVYMHVHVCMCMHKVRDLHAYMSVRVCMYVCMYACIRTGERKAVRTFAFARRNLELAQDFKQYQYKVD